MRKNTQNNMVTINVNGVAITCTAEQAIAIASACTPTSKASSTPARKATAKTSTKSSKSTSTKSTKTSTKSKKQTAPKQPKAVELANVTRNGKTVGFDKPINKVVFKFHSELAKKDNATYATVNGCPTWTFTSEAKAKAFEKKAHAQLTDSEFTDATTPKERTQADKDARNAAYKREWDKFVAKCEKDGIKRTSEMNRAESKRINAMLASK